MAAYHFYVQQLSGYFDGCEFHQVSRAENEAADALAKLGSTRGAIPPGISLEHIRKPSIKPSPDSESIITVPPDPGAAGSAPSGSPQPDPGALPQLVARAPP
jgi:hypothetical protein